MANVVTNGGKANIAAGINRTGNVPSYVGWGTGAGTSGATDTTLFTEDSGGSPAYARVNGTTSIVTTTVTNDTFQTVALLTANAGKTITNAGCWDSLSGGVLCAKGDFAGVVLATSDSIQITGQIQAT